MSIEWIAYDADVIVSGRLRRYEDAEGPKSRKFKVVSLDVDEMFKGENAKELKFAIWRAGGEELLPPLPYDRPVLVFLARSARFREDLGGALPCPLALLNYPEPPSLIRLLDDQPRRPKSRGWGTKRPAGPPGLFDTDFNEYRHPEEMLPVVRRAVQAVEKGKPASCRIEVPPLSEVYDALWSGSAVYLEVPLDGAMMKKAEAWLASSSINQRVAGVRVLGGRKSDENIARLKTLLLDSMSLNSSRGEQLLRIYPVREEAYRALKAWGVEVDPPVTEERRGP